MVHRPGLAQKVFTLFFFIYQAKSHSKRCLGLHLEVPDILLPDVSGQLFWVAVRQLNLSWAEGGEQLRECQLYGPVAPM